MSELRDCAPDVLDLLAAVGVPKIKGDGKKQVLPICTAYGILMNCRWRELSLVQKVNTVLLAVGNTSAKVG